MYAYLSSICLVFLILAFLPYVGVGRTTPATYMDTKNPRSWKKESFSKLSYARFQN